MSALYDLAADGDTVLVGDQNAGGDSTGAAWTVSRDGGGVWGAGTPLVLPVATGDTAGTAVALEGDVAIVGAPQNVFGASQVGEVHVARRVAGTWGFDQTLAPVGSPTASYGWSVSVSGEWLVVGGPEDDGARGRVWIYRQVADSWVAFTDFASPSPFVQQRFGWAVAVDGTTLAVIAHGEGMSGAVHFYEFDGAWGHQLTAEVGNLIGDPVSEIALRGDVCVVGAPGESGLYDFAGAAVVFERPAGPASWFQSQALRAPDADPYDQFGLEVDVDDGRILVQSDPLGLGFSGTDDLGISYLFEQASGDAWEATALLTSAPTTQFEGPRRGAALLDDVVALGGVHNDALATPKSAVHLVPLPIFADGFESGDTLAWTASTP